MVRYPFKQIEAKWQRTWDERATFRVPLEPGRPKYYVLEMFPYPSGRIHMGHVRNYTLGDVVARHRRARGYDVLHPMGWDAFGLPAENAAMAKGVHPAAWTHANIDEMRAQLKSMGLSLDWSREIATCDPDYYRHEQAMFLDFLDAGLVERKESWVNWDPLDQTVLANEQVIDGRGWRSGAVVERRKLAQWFLKITEYSQDLLDALDHLERWPDKVRLMQEKWIGRSEGALVRFPIIGRERPLEVFTTRPDTLFGASFMALAPDHPLSRELAERDPGVGAFIAECAKLGTSEEVIEQTEKLGYDTGLRCRNPLVEDQELPVYVANFVLMEYGTGAIFGCPAHDQRDLEFARKYGRPVVPVVLPPGEDAARFAIADEAYLGDGTLINSGFLDGLDVPAAKRAAIRRLEKLRGGARRDHLPAARLGRLAPALLGLPDPGDPLWRMRRRSGAARAAAGDAAGGHRDRPARQSARPPPELEARALSRAAVGRPSARPTPSIPSSKAPGIFSASARRTPRRRSSARRSRPGCRSISTSAGSSMPSCICSIRASSRAR